MRRYVYYFIVFQLLDIITTYIGLNMGLTEGNGLFRNIDLLTTFLIKLFVVYVLAEMMQKLKYCKWFWVVAIESSIFALWNGMNILLVVMV